MRTATKSPALSRWGATDWSVRAMAGLLVLVALAAYSNSFGGPFIYDDVSSITDNPTIRHLWPLTDVLVPPRDSGVTVSGRPVVNLSLAINYALGGTGVRGYHAVNLLIHTLAGLVLFGLVRRTLLRPALRERFLPSAAVVAWSIAAWWVAHPVQTESVTYVIQRAESLVGLFYLLTLYCLARTIDAPAARIWPVLTVLCCLFGMASKEVMVSAPLVALFYDRTFGAGTFSGAWAARRRLHLALTSTLILLAFLVAGTRGRGGTAGFGAGGIAWWQYAFTQCRAIVRYLWVIAWPQNLVFDYGVSVDKTFVPIAPQALMVVLLLAGTAWTLWRRPTGGFLGLCFLAILAPSSSCVPIVTETMAEHRLYLALAPVVAAGVVITFTLCGRHLLWPCLALPLAGVALSVQRNETYGDEFALWRDTLRKWPANVRAHNNVGEILYRRYDRPEEAIAEFREAVRLEPRYVDALDNLGNVLARSGRPREALQTLEIALQLRPDYAPTHNNLGNALVLLGRGDEARAHFAEAVRLRPSFAEAHNNLGVLLSKAGRLAEAIQHFQRALALSPDYADAHYNYANALVDENRISEAASHYLRALAIRPSFPEALNNLGRARYLEGRRAEAIACFEQATRLKPDYAEAHSNLAGVLYEVGRIDEAVVHFRRALEIDPALTTARDTLNFLLNEQRRAEHKP